MKITASILLIFCYLQSLSQDSVPVFSPDRPGQTTGTHVVSKGYFQIETGTGIDISNNNADNTKNLVFQYNSTLLRYGLFDNLEIRLSSGFEHTLSKPYNSKENTVYNNAFIPVSGGIKTKLCENNNILPSISFFGQLSWLYFADKNQETDLLLPLFGFSFNNGITNYLSVACNIGATWYNSAAGEMITNYFYTLAIGISPFDKFGFFIEPFGNIDRTNNNLSNIDCGISYTPANNIQLDIFVIPDIKSDNINEFSIAGGISWRLPE